MVRKLKIKCLEDDDGNLLDGDLIVGETFVDRPGRQADRRDYTVRVERESPDPEDLQNPVRFASLAPESSARPRKRQRNSLLGEATTGRYEVNQLLGNYGQGHKRQRLEDLRDERVHDPDRPLLSSERDINMINDASQSSTFVVSDSQRSPGRDRKYMNFQHPQEAHMFT